VENLPGKIEFFLPGSTTPRFLTRLTPLAIRAIILAKLLFYIALAGFHHSLEAFPSSFLMTILL